MKLIKIYISGSGIFGIKNSNIGSLSIRGGAIVLKTVGFVGPPKGKLSDVELSIEQVSPC
ncbi:hypothetical protein [Microcoleus sp.]|uniref:hypothetical protein n=1 Tax=Microcoleus sp. TaxID=44472 RepID=UPI00403E5EDD